MLILYGLSIKAHCSYITLNSSCAWSGFLMRPSFSFFKREELMRIGAGIKHWSNLENGLCGSFKVIRNFYIIPYDYNNWIKQESKFLNKRVFILAKAFLYQMWTLICLKRKTWHDVMNYEYHLSIYELLLDRWAIE